ncbi:1-aminocyclopropane-1-carboxylate oxidase [Smittium culicis]|uniref:1-aminocyclopropane-1-carboxylate oxidase n=1 Tax=Smittium culicis TaxID=133412 RepID=A0A1R1XJ00_9FUNG|nr:1-aminocyclopropane-1-carboxylate oxidase [Smittium culicis]
MTKSTDFSTIPILDLNLAKTGKLDQLLDELRHALLYVGFFYVKNHSIPQSLLDRSKELAVKFFDSPQEVKDKYDKIFSSSFLGYSKQGFETTKGKKDNREQFDFADGNSIEPSPENPEYFKLYAPFKYPSDEDVEGFESTYKKLLGSYKKLSSELIELVALSLGLAADAFEKYFDKIHRNRAKVIKYPSVSELDSNDGDQGVGPHKDTAGLLTLLYQANDVPGLQVQNHSGEWIDATPIPGTLVINIGSGLETLTSGLTVATTHRVLNPPAGRGPRYSIPYFRSVRLDKPFEVLDLPSEYDHLKYREVISDNDDQFKELFLNNLSKALLLNRIKSHPDVGYKYYPELAAEIGISADTKF